MSQATSCELLVNLPPAFSFSFSAASIFILQCKVNYNFESNKLTYKARRLELLVSRGAEFHSLKPSR